MGRSTGGAVGYWAHEGTRHFYNISDKLAWDSPMCNGGLIGFNALDPLAVRTIAEPVRCRSSFNALTGRSGETAARFASASRPRVRFSGLCDVLTDPGSSRANHRQDQAVLSVLFAINNRTCLYTEGQNFRDLHFPDGVEGVPTEGWAITLEHDAPGDGSEIIPVLTDVPVQ